MPFFTYRAYRQDGTSAENTVEADSSKDAIRRLKEEGYFVKGINEVTPTKRRFFRYADKSWLPNITRQLAILLGAGVPITEAVQSLAREHKGLWRQTLVTLKEHIVQGKTLSKALEEHRNIFPDFYIAMVAAGEAGGHLNKVLSNLADFLERQHNLKSKFTASLIYPFIMIGVSFVVVAFLFTFVIPKLAVIFEANQAALPLITRILLAISQALHSYWWLLVGLALVCLMPIRKALSRYKQSIDRLILRLPGGLFQSLYYGRLARVLSFLLMGGVSHLNALRLAARTLSNAHLEEKILKAQKMVSEGASLSTSLQGLPPTFIQLVNTGEKSGKIAEVLDKAAQRYEQDFLARTQRFVSLIEPVFILVMGLIVAFIVFAIHLPIFQLNQMIK